MEGEGKRGGKERVRGKKWGPREREREGRDKGTEERETDRQTD